MLFIAINDSLIPQLVQLSAIWHLYKLLFFLGMVYLIDKVTPLQPNYIGCL